MNIKDALNEFESDQEDYAMSRERILKMAVDNGASEKALNGDHRCAVWYLRGCLRRTK